MFSYQIYNLYYRIAGVLPYNFKNKKSTRTMFSYQIYNLCNRMAGVLPYNFKNKKSTRTMFSYQIYNLCNCMAGVLPYNSKDNNQQEQCLVIRYVTYVIVWHVSYLVTLRTIINKNNL